VRNRTESVLEITTVMVFVEELVLFVEIFKLQLRKNVAERDWKLLLLLSL
jgi:hypothetical protein